MPIWINFVGSCDGRCRYILWTFGLFYGHLVYFVAIWYNVWLFGKFWYVVPIKSGNPALRPLSLCAGVVCWQKNETFVRQQKKIARMCLAGDLVMGAMRYFWPHFTELGKQQNGRGMLGTNLEPIQLTPGAIFGIFV
jgi:hypothetical protein